MRSQRLECCLLETAPRPSRRPLRGLLRMRSLGLRSIRRTHPDRLRTIGTAPPRSPHPEERPQGASRRTRTARFRIGAKRSKRGAGMMLTEDAPRPSRRPLRGLLRMRSFGLRSIRRTHPDRLRTIGTAPPRSPHPEERRRRVSKDEDCGSQFPSLLFLCRLVLCLRQIRSRHRLHIFRRCLASEKLRSFRCIAFRCRHFDLQMKVSRQSVRFVKSRNSVLALLNYTPSSPHTSRISDMSRCAPA